MNRDPMISSRLHVVDDAWPIDEEEELGRFDASRPPRGSRGGSRNPHPRRNRVVTAAVALAVFLFGSVLAWRGFNPVGTSTPAATPSPQATVQASISTFDTGLRSLEGAVVADGSVWVAGSNGDSQKGQLVRIDPATGQVLARIDVPVPGWEFGGAGITAARGSVWILSYPSEANAAQGGSWLYRIDPATNSMADAVRVSDQDASDLWVDDTGIWILTWAGSDHMTVSSLDPSTYAVLQTTRLETSWSQTIAVAGGHVWVFGSTQGDAPAETLFELEPQTLATIDTIQPTGGSSFFLTMSGDRIWFHHDGLQALDASTGQQDIGPIGHPVNDCCAALTPDGVGGVWVLDPSGASPGLWHVDADGVIDSVDESGFGPKVDGNASTFDPVSGTLWVVHYDGTVTRIDLRPIEQSSPPSSETSAPQTGASYLAPYLRGGMGWNFRTSGLVPANRRNGTVAWASTIPISQDDVQLGAAIPPTTITELPPDGIVVTVEVVPASFKDTSVPFPYAGPSFDLSKASQRGPEGEEPAGNYSVMQMDNNDVATLVRVYFGSPNPSAELIAKAQAELDTLQLPPTCTVGGEGSYSVSASATQAVPGDAITLSGRVPFQHEDGSFDESGTGQMVAWWNVAPDDWTSLVAGSPSPSPAVGGQAIAQLGSAPMNSCEFSIPFTIPDVSPGDYPVLVLQQGGGGAALEGSAIIHVASTP